MFTPRKLAEAKLWFRCSISLLWWWLKHAASVSFTCSYRDRHSVGQLEQSDEDDGHTDGRLHLVASRPTASLWRVLDPFRVFIPGLTCAGGGSRAVNDERRLLVYGTINAAVRRKMFGISSFALKLPISVSANLRCNYDKVASANHLQLINLQFYQRVRICFVSVGAAQPAEQHADGKSAEQSWLQNKEVRCWRVQQATQWCGDVSGDVLKCLEEHSYSQFSGNRLPPGGGLKENE